MKIYKRSTWTNSPKGGDRRPPVAKTLYFHHSVTPGKNLTTMERMKQAIRNLRAIHLGNGWSDVGYNLGITEPAGKHRRAKVWELRGVDRVPAAQGGANQGTIACVVIGNFESTHLDRATLRAMKRLAKHARKRWGVRYVGGHQEAPGQSTACPGKNIMKHLDEIAKYSGLQRV